MEDIEHSMDDKKPKVKWRWLLIALFVGGALTAVCFVLETWWVATALLLVTLAAICLALPRAAYPLVFTLYAMFAIGWLSGALVDQFLGPERFSPAVRILVSFACGALIGVAIPVVAWLLVLFVSTQWIMAVSDSLDVSLRDALWFVATRVFGASQAYVIVENGQVATESSQGLFAKFGGPGVLIVRPGNAVVLERGGKVTGIKGPGTHKLKRSESLKRPEETKGIVDLRPQGAGQTVSGVLTKDGIPLEITVGAGFQIEPKEVTDRRPSSHFEGGEARSPLIEGDYPVYERTIYKAVFNTGENGWRGMFPGGPIAILRDVVSSYTLDQILTLDPDEKPDPDARTVRQIEKQVLERFDASRAGVWFKSIDIQGISVPEDVQQRLLRRWTTAVERKIRVEEAMGERDAMIELSKARAESLDRLETVRLDARTKMMGALEGLVVKLRRDNQEQFVLSLVDILQEIANRIGQDEMVAMRYIETMQAIVQSPGTKSFVITPPTPPQIMPGQGTAEGREQG